MSISLSKGSSVNLTKEEPALKKIVIGLGWDTGQNSIDLDASAFILSANGGLSHWEMVHPTVYVDW